MKKEKKTKKKVSLKPYLAAMFRGNMFRLFLAGMEVLLNVAVNLFIAWLLQQIMDLIGGENTGFTLWELVGLTGLCIGLCALGCFLGYHSRPQFLSRGIAQYRAYVFRRLTQKSASAFSGENTSLYLSALSSDAATIETGLLENLMPTLESSLLFAGALTMMFLYSPLLTLISIGLSLLPLVASILTGSRAEEAEKQVSQANASFLDTLKDALTGFPVVKAFRAEGQICGLVEERVQSLAQANTRKRKVSVFVGFLAAASGLIAQFGVFLAGAYLAVTRGTVTAGTVVVFVQMINYVLAPLGNIPTYLARGRAALALMRKLGEALEDNVREGGTREKDHLAWGISLEHLRFGYVPEQPVLQDLTLTFEAGKRYAIVGASGSGKSTLLNMLMAAYPDYSGAVFYDDVEARDLKTEALYGLLSVIQQNVFLFNATIRENITLFSDFPEAEVDRAMALSGLSELVEQKGADFQCGENGCKLSGGEKQRVAIARSLLRQSSVLLVDEATAALDPQTARQVAQAILDLDGMTRIVVTHALEESLLEQYDGIVALKGGRAVETGTFRELMAARGYFYSLFNLAQ